MTSSATDIVHCRFPVRVSVHETVLLSTKKSENIIKGLLVFWIHRVSSINQSDDAIYWFIHAQKIWVLVNAQEQVKNEHSWPLFKFFDGFCIKDATGYHCANNQQFFGCSKYTHSQMIHVILDISQDDVSKKLIKTRRSVGCTNWQRINNNRFLHMSYHEFSEFSVICHYLNSTMAHQRTSIVNWTVMWTWPRITCNFLFLRKLGTCSGYSATKIFLWAEGKLRLALMGICE